MTGSVERVEELMGPTAVVQLAGERLELVRHPSDGHVVVFANADDAFAFALSLELAGTASAGTVHAPEGMPVHMLDPGAAASEVMRPMEQAA
jgi:hypothetical protein